MSVAVCPLCAHDGGTLLWREPRLRVILADEPDYPGYTRVVWNHHVAEMTDLAPADRERLMRVVFLVETMQREHLRPDKVNLAALGNMVPHLHWHIIPRRYTDPAFPDAVWASARRASSAAIVSDVPAYVVAVRQALDASMT